jgi:hypothetical protein
MALAALYAEIHAVDPFLPRAHGFIVDHRVRAESTEEAKWVAEQLRSKCKDCPTMLSGRGLMR